MGETKAADDSGAFFILAEGFLEWPHPVPVEYWSGDEATAQRLCRSLGLEFRDELPALTSSWTRVADPDLLVALQSKCQAARDGQFGTEVETVCQSAYRQKRFLKNAQSWSESAGKLVTNPAPSAVEPEQSEAPAVLSEADAVHNEAGSDGKARTRAGAPAEPDTRAGLNAEPNTAGENVPVPKEPIAHSKRVALFGPADPPTIDDEEQSGLTKAQYDVVMALIRAGEKGLTKDGLDTESGHGDARKVMERLAKKSSKWADVLRFPKATGRGYRIE